MNSVGEGLSLLRMNSGTNFKAAAEADEEEKSSEEQKKKKKCISEFWNREEKKPRNLPLSSKQAHLFIQR